jgi:hypothetical protein
MARDVLCIAVLTPGARGYATHRTLFTFKGMTVMEAPGSFDRFQSETALVYKVSVTPDFQDTHAKAWATVWKERAKRWLRRLGR